ncbi:MAG: hypothetical protein H0X43_08730 [Nitrosospira sp.]|nr:hypothetical protein [Nitrosospira sp.]
MKTILLALFFALGSSQLLAQKETQEFPWSKAAKIIDAEEEKSVAPKPKKTDPQQLERDIRKPEKKIETENKKSK